MNSIKWLNKLKTLNFGINPPCTAEEIKEIESLISFSFPIELIEIYLLINGQKTRAYTTEHLCYLMPMNEIKEAFFSFDKKDFIPIFDYACGCDYIGFIKNKQGLFFYEGSCLNGEYIVAYDSIEEFLEWAFQ
jgi:SMI1 / KNR4 family (SUKH-1)